MLETTTPISKRIVIAVAVLLCLLASTGSVTAKNLVPSDQCEVGPIGEPIPVSALGKAAIGLHTETITLQPLSAQITTTGKIEPIPTREFNQQALISGRINRVLVQPGEAVHAGQVLLMVDSPEINQLAAETLQNKFGIESEIHKTAATLDAEINQAQAQLNLAELNLKRSQQLVNEGIGAKKDMQNYVADVAYAKNRLDVAIQQKEIALKALRTKLRIGFESLLFRLRQLGVPEGELKNMLLSQNTIKEVPVTSTKSGVITDIQASAGSSVSQSVPLFKVSDLGVVWATADVYEDDMSRIRLGQNVLVKVGALPNEVFRGKVTFIGRLVDPATRTLPVRVEINNPGLRLKPDMFATLYIETGEASQSLVIPREAVVERTGHDVVFVDSPAGFQAYQVELGRSVGDNVEIVRGIKPGQHVVTQGSFQLDAELLKSHGRTDLFIHPVEGEREQADLKQTSGSSQPSWQVIAVLVFAAFLLGIVASVLLFRSHHPKTIADASRSVTADQEALPKS